MKRVTIATGLLCLLFAVTGAQEKNRFAVAGVNEREVEVFFAAFKEAVAHGQKQRVAAIATPRGEIWINGVMLNRNSDDYEIKITSINGPIKS